MMESMEIDQGKQNKEEHPIVLLLVGLPGSGKSTFCDEVMKCSLRPWNRVCQDTINNGKAGTKIQCLSVASNALKDGKSVFIDRCNIDREQRADFIRLGVSQTEKHAVVLDLPAKVCISRSVKRTGHDGNLQGSKAAAVVNQMAPRKALPKLNEGFSRITFCQDEKEVTEAINLYRSFGLSDSLPSGCFGQKKHDTKIQQGIMKFLKKVEPSVEKESGIQMKMDPHTQGDASEKLEKVDENERNSVFNPGAISNNGVPTLAFPSISTADFQFNLGKASDIIVEKVEEFLRRIGNARLVLVDLSHESKILSLVKSKAAQKNIDPNKFFTFVGDITRLRSQRGLECNVIANAANWRLKPGGGGVNAAIFKAAGTDLEIATKERAVTLRSGKAVVVPLPSSSPLSAKEGVTHVIHVLGPNMNPRRPDCLENDYVEGCKLLREAYSALFEGFVSILKSNGDETGGSPESEDSREVLVNEVDRKIETDTICEHEKRKKYKGSQEAFEPTGSSSVCEKNVNTNKIWSSWPPWAQALYNVVMHPDKHKNLVLDMLDDVLVINDAYPKARRHVLVLARADGLDSIADVCGENTSLLKKMHEVGLKWAKKFINEDKSLLFRLGYHSVPSMRQLHLHVISQDFDSDHLKNKKHWNSFNTCFFLDSVDVIKEAECSGKVTPGDEKLLAMELRCHRCRSVHPNMPRLKSHIKSCRAPFPAARLRNGRLVSLEKCIAGA